MQTNKKSFAAGFSLLEVLIAMLVVGVVFGMIMTAVTVLDKVVANETIVPLKVPGAAANTPVLPDATALHNNWGYWDAFNSTGVAVENYQVNFSVAPSRAADAKADALWRQMKDLYEQSTAVAVMNQYVLHDFHLGDFVGDKGYLTSLKTPLPSHTLTYAQLTNQPNTTAVPAVSGDLEFYARQLVGFGIWETATRAGLNIDERSYRAMTIFFLAPQDRILGILRARAWQYTGNIAIPYRYYEVGLAKLRWKLKDSSATGAMAEWVLDDTADVNNPNFIESFGYRFVEDRRYPQDLIFPLNGSGRLYAMVGGSNGTLGYQLQGTRMTFFRLAIAGESYDLVSDWNSNTNPGVSRRQVSLVPSGAAAGPILTAGASEWHIILPDPSLSQGEERAAARATGSSSILANTIRQGKYGCALSVYP